MPNVKPIIRFLICWPTNGKKRKKNHSDIHLHSNDNRSDDELCAAMVLFLKLFFKLFEHSIICLVIDEGKNYRDCIGEIKQYDMSSSTNDIWPEAVVSSILIDCKLFMNGTQNVFSKFSNYSINILFLSRAHSHTHTHVSNGLVYLACVCSLAGSLYVCLCRIFTFSMNSNAIDNCFIVPTTTYTHSNTLIHIYIFF